MEYAMKNLEEINAPEYCVTTSGKVYSLKSKRFLNIQYNDNGYPCITLRIEGKTKTFKVHRLVALSYLKDTYFEGAHVNHKDGDKTNSCVDNLEWVTRSENMIHAYQNGLIVSKIHKLTDDEVHLICQFLEQGSRVPDIANMFNVDRNQIYSIIDGKAYNYISFEYNLLNVPKQQKLSPEKVIEVCELLVKNTPLKNISESTNVHISSVKAIKQRRTQTHISNSYDW